MEEAGTPRWALGVGLTRSPRGEAGPRCLLPDGFFWERGFVSEALVSEVLNESLDATVSIATPWTSAGSSLTQEIAPRAGFSNSRVSTDLLRCSEDGVSDSVGLG